MFWELNELALFLSVLALFLGALEAAFRLGNRRLDRHDEAAKNHIGSIQGSVMGLLALLLGFTFAMAVSRYDLRKSLVLEEANAIGTTYLRTQFLAPEQQREAADLLKRYVVARLDFYNAGIDNNRLDAANAEAARIENRLWQTAVAASAADPRSVSTGLFVQALNDVIDNQEKRQTAFENHVPNTVNGLLLVVSVIALSLMGYGCGLNGRRHGVTNSIVALLLALVFTAILDIDRPRRGLIQVSQNSLLRLQDTLNR